MCEAFQCTPLEAYQQPLPLVLEILEARSFAQTYEAEEEASKPDGGKHPEGRMADLLMEFAKEDYVKMKELKSRE